MKRTRVVAKIMEPAKPTPAAILTEDEDKLPIESNLSPERTMEGASTTTAVLNQILAQREGFHQLRDWGINE